MWVQFISTLLPAQEIGKLVTVPMKSHSYCGLSDLALFAVYQSGVHSVDSRFLEALCLCFKGTQRQKEMWKTYIVRAGNKFWVTV